MRRSFARIVLLGGWLRSVVPRWLRDSGRSRPQDNGPSSKEEFLRCAKDAATSKNHIAGFSALLELNTGLPFALTARELSQSEPSQYLAALLARVKQVAPDIDPGTIENIVIQYYLQTGAQHDYRLQRYDGDVALFEPNGPHSGLLAAQFRPYVRRLRARYVALGTQSDRTQALAESFPKSIRAHFLSMRDEVFVKRLAEELGTLLR
jgi:hypothetical protein